MVSKHEYNSYLIYYEEVATKNHIAIASKIFHYTEIEEKVNTEIEAYMLKNIHFYFFLYVHNMLLC